MSKSFAFRLMTYFLLISLLPILVLSFYFYTSVSRTLNANLADQANQSLDRVIASLSDCLDDYRHRSYAISVSDTIRRELSQQGSVPSQEIYQQLYQSMRGTIYDASAHIISSDGRNKYSTHEFPDHYDLRYNSNDVSIASMLASFTTPTLLLAERYSNKRQDLVVLNLIRAITDSDGTLLGYVIIDLFSTTISNLCNESVFSDIILIDRLTLKAYSLLHTDTFGDYNRFPALTEPSTTSGFDTVRLTSNQIIAQKPIRSTQFSIAGIIETPPYTMLLNRISWVSLIVLALSVAAALLFAYFASKHISKPVSTL
ncbi:MAG: cache domain-containing protein, partial [Spirochaetales bacterium]|nr:cache domain-containing protein [Spirochaetales bacterium]